MKKSFFIITLVVVMLLTTFLPITQAFAEESYDKVRGVSASVKSYNSITVKWDRASGADGYFIYRSTNKKSGFKQIKVIDSGSTTSYTNTNLKTGTRYYYKVAYFVKYEGKRYRGYSSSVVSAKPTINAPANFEAAISGTSIKLSWGKSTGATAYQVYRATNYSGSYKFIKATKSLSYTDKSVSAGKQYYYKIVPYRTSGGAKLKGKATSPKSAMVSAEKTYKLSLSGNGYFSNGKSFMEGYYKAGERVKLDVDVYDDYTFEKWRVWYTVTNNKYEDNFEDATQNPTYFTMPDEQVTIVFDTIKKEEKDPQEEIDAATEEFDTLLQDLSAAGSDIFV